MERSMISPKSLIFDLYLRPSLLVIGLYQTIVTVAFTSQQLLLAAYLDEKGYILISGIIIAVYFAFWFLLGPFFSTLSDLHGRKFLMIAANFVSLIGFFGLVLAPESLFIETVFIMNAILGIGAAIRVGSVIALWVQHSPQDRVGESLAYNSILLTIGGFTGALIGFLMWSTIKEQAFVIFGILLFVSAIPIFFVSDVGNYIPFSFEFLRVQRNKSDLQFFFTPQFIQVCLHWLAFSTIVSFSTFIIPILERLTEETSSGSDVNLPFPLLFVISAALVISCVGGLLFWGRISDLWARRPVLIIGYVGMAVLVLSAMVIFLFDWLPMLLEGLAFYNPLSIIVISIVIISIFAAVSVIATPMALISDKVGHEDLAKAMSLRQVLIGVGTVIGVFIGGFVIGLFEIPGLLFVILILLLISAVILL
ncbi:MAG: MFS transporter [Candidatus Heimdallarchaeota archaeon]|nr:MAG: MFS transporter [Candidatus Heimdallarchaeota archaeon]